MQGRDIRFPRWCDAPPTLILYPFAAGLDFYGYFYVNGRYFHVSNLNNWTMFAKAVRGSTAKHKGKAQPIFNFVDGKCEVCGCWGEGCCCYVIVCDCAGGLGSWCPAV